jgi:hypothetical protein
MSVSSNQKGKQIMNKPNKAERKVIKQNRDNRKNARGRQWV